MNLDQFYVKEKRLDRFFDCWQIFGNGSFTSWDVRSDAQKTNKSSN